MDIVNEGKRDTKHTKNHETNENNQLFCLFLNFSFVLSLSFSKFFVDIFL